MIHGFSRYSLTSDNKVINVITNKEVTQTLTKKGESRLKLYDDIRGWRSVTITEVLAKAGIKLELPITAKQIAYSTEEYYIDIDGTVYSFTKRSKQGKILKHRITTNGYLSVQIHYKGKVCDVDIHKLVAETFLMRDYTIKKLCCMHKDNNKLNCHVDNLCIGTYSQNNKDAYRDNLNTGNLEWRMNKTDNNLKQG